MRLLACIRMPTTQSPDIDDAVRLRDPASLAPTRDRSVQVGDHRQRAGEILAGTIAAFGHQHPHPGRGGRARGLRVRETVMAASMIVSRSTCRRPRPACRACPGRR